MQALHVTINEKKTINLQRFDTIGLDSVPFTHKPENIYNFCSNYNDKLAVLASFIVTHVAFASDYNIQWTKHRLYKAGDYVRRRKLHTDLIMKTVHTINNGLR